MTKDELFEIVTKIVASPHTSIVEHDKRRAIQVFLAFEEYVLDNFQDDDTENGVSYVKSKDIEFGSYASQQLDILEGK